MMSDFFDFEIAEQRRIEKEKKWDDFFSKIKCAERNTYIFGAGVYAKELLSYLESRGAVVKGFFVDDQYADETNGLLALSCIERYDHINLVYGIGDGFSERFFEKTKEIQEKMRGCKNSEFFILDDFWLVEKGLSSITRGCPDETFVKAHFDEFQKTYEMLADDFSKNVMREYIYSSVCRDGSRLEQFGSSRKYDYDFELLFQNCHGDVVVECGAFDGKTIVDASEYTKHKYEMIALECDPKNFKKCCERTSSLSNISVVKLGAWDKKAKLAVVQLDSASFLKEVDYDSDGTDLVEVVSVDSLAPSKKIAAIVMDIEGGEMKALAGAQNAIKRGANLAVRVYHKMDDLITIPQYIRELNNQYKFFIRYPLGATLLRTCHETTLYAICEK